LANLVNLGLAPLALKIDQLPDALSPENVVATAGALLKPQPLEQAAQVIKIDVRIRLALQNPKPQLLLLAHQP
jgi:hypothetical protein